MLADIWAFLTDENTQKTLTWLGGGLVVIGGSVWTVYLKFKKSTETRKQQDNSGDGIRAEGDGIIAGGTITMDSSPNAVLKTQGPTEVRSEGDGSLAVLGGLQNSPVTINYQPQETAGSSGLVKHLTQSLATQAKEFGVKEGLLISLAERYAEGSPDNFEAALTGLQRALEVAHAEAERGRLPSNTGDAVAAVLERMDALNDAGRIDEAAAALETELVEINQEDERRKAVRTRLYEKGIAQAILTRIPEDASRFVLAGLDLNPPSHPNEQFDALISTQAEWYERGRDKGLNFDLEVSILLAQEAAARAQTQDQRGMTQNNLGNALQVLGAREAGTARLEEAVRAYRLALEERTRARVPLDWAQTQNNLGNALQELGEREAGTARLEEAVTAFRLALEEMTRDLVPLDWATTQNNLGDALRVLGTREAGTARLEEAVTAFRLALEERTRDRVPLDWAMTQNNLGAALRVLGEREAGTGRLEEAVTAYRLALEERTRARVPLDWAMTQNNLGNALKALGARETGTARLEEAVTAYRLALEERTRDRVPLSWATTQNNLGNALQELGAREAGTARLEEAVTAYRLALEEWTRDRVPLDWAMTQNNLGNALNVLGEKGGGWATFAKAKNAFELSAEEYFKAYGDRYSGYFEDKIAETNRRISEHRDGE